MVAMDISCRECRKPFGTFQCLFSGSERARWPASASASLNGGGTWVAAEAEQAALGAKEYVLLELVLVTHNLGALAS